MLRSLAAKSRDNARTPMLWDASEHGGFTTGTPWLPANADRDVINAAAAVADPDSVFHHYRRLIELRHDDPVVVDGRFALLLPGRPAGLGVHPHPRRRRAAGARELLLDAGHDRARDACRRSSGSEVLLPTHGTSYALTLQPWESRVHRL